MTVALTVIFLVAVIVAVIYIFLIMPRASDRADMDLLSTDYAHRGLHNGSYPENSLPAFYAAVQRGYGIELDLRMTKDGHAVVFHDPTAKRMCGVSRRIADMTLTEVKSLSLKGTIYTVPTLSEVLSLVDGTSPILIEIKSEGKTDKATCRRIAQMLDTYPGAFAIQSFDPLVLGWFKRYRPRFARGQLVTHVKQVKGHKHPRLAAIAVSGMLTNFISRPDFISVNGMHMRSLSFRICVLLFKCKGFVWTVRRQEQYDRVHRTGFFAIFENFTPN